MSKIGWDETLETCVTTNMSALLTAGYPPFFRSRDGLCTGMVPSLSAEDIISLIDEIVPSHVEEVPGCRSFRLNYRKTEKFRVDVLNNPNAHSIILTRLPKDAPASLLDGVGWYKGWCATGNQMTWEELVGATDSDGLMVTGCPPFGWSEWGLHVYGKPPLSSQEIAATVNTIMPAPEWRGEESGVIRFRTPFTQDGVEFLASVLGYPDPRILLLTKLELGIAPVDPFTTGLT